MKHKKLPDVDFFYNGLCSHCHDAKNQLLEFAEFHAETEEAWKEKDQALQKQIDKLLKERPEEDHQDIVENYSWDLHQHQDRFPSIHRESLVITLYNYLEAHLNELCNTISESIESDIELKDLNGNGIQRARLFLTKVVGFDLSKLNQEWEYIVNFNRLRNQIVHNAGYLVDDTNDKLNKFVQEVDTLSGEAGRRIRIQPGFINQLLDILSQFFDKLDDEVQAFIQSFND